MEAVIIDSVQASLYDSIFDSVVSDSSPAEVSVFDTGIWNDEGIWDDTDIWQD